MATLKPVVRKQKVGPGQIFRLVENGTWIRYNKKWLDNSKWLKIKGLDDNSKKNS